MASKNLVNLVVSTIALLLIILTALKYCNIGGKLYSDKYVQNVIKQHEQKYEGEKEVLQDQLNIQASIASAANDRVIELEKTVDSLTVRYAKSSAKLKPANKGAIVPDTGYTLAPNEFVEDCKDCMNTLTTYRDANEQLRFERDSYDTLMRKQNELNEARIREVEGERLIFNKMFNDCQSARASIGFEGNTRKLKLSGAGMLNNLFLPRAGGFGLIYEDKRFNEFGGHVLFSSQGEIYLLHIAKTISFKRKK